MDAVTGRTLSHYQILEKLGEGGMGVVYKARDTHLNRLVAVKVLPPEKVADPQRKARFVQEAKAASALNHPNIIHIYDIDQQDAVDFIVMEYVAGKTLDQVIPRKGMRVSEALKIATQIAGALARAHAAGIVHRDLKPGNVMVDEHGLVKVLDFGLAKLVERDAPEDATTAVGIETDEGTVVGSASYMSPEQAEGKPVDGRSDIFAFGAVLYELVTGQRAFQGDSSMSTLAAVINREPAPPGEDVPSEVRRVISHCLRKDPTRRFQHMDDVRGLLEELKEESDSGKLVRGPAGVSRSSAPWRLVAAAGLLATAVGVWALWYTTRTPAPAPRLLPLTSYQGRETHPSFSPDGRWVAFSWNGEKQDNVDVYVQVVGSGEPHRRTTDPAPDSCPVWSPDSTQIAFVRIKGDQAAVYVVPALGGSERKVTDFLPVPGLDAFLGPAISWSPDGKWLAVPELDAGATNGIVLVPAERGEKQTLISGSLSAGRFHWPAFSPRGDTLAFASCTGDRSCDLNLLDLGRDYTPQGQPRRLTRQGAVVEGIAWMPGGRSLVYAAAADIAAGFSLWRVLASGGAEPERMDLAGAATRHPAVSRAGDRLVLSRYEWDLDIWRFEGNAAPQRLASSTRGETDPHFSPDGRRIAFITNRSGKGSELWVADRDGTNPVRLTEGAGRQLGSPRWSPDGRWIAFDAAGEDGHWDIYLIDAAGGQPRRLTPESSEENLPRWSHDGKWIYFASDRSGRYEVWRTPAAGGASVQITHDGGFEAAESPDGKILYYTKRPQGGFVSPLFARPLAGGEERQVLDSVFILSFAVVENGIYHVVRSGFLSFGFEIRLKDLTTGEDRVIRRSDLVGIQGLAVSPDRKTILYCGSSGPNSDLMLVEGYR